MGGSFTLSFGSPNISEPTYTKGKSMTDEVFVDIPGYEGHYQVSNHGQVRSLARKDPTNPAGVRCVDRLLRQEVTHSKCAVYQRVALCKGGKVRRFAVHRLVAQVFIPNPERKPQVNHKDFDGRNNHVDNLEWVTGQENMMHSARAGRQDMPRRVGFAAALDWHQQRADSAAREVLGDNLIRTWVGHNAGTFTYVKRERLVEYRCMSCSTQLIEKLQFVKKRRGECANCHVRMKI